MRTATRLLSLLCLSIAAACGSEGPTDCCIPGNSAVRVVNAFTTPVDVLIDGGVVIQTLGVGSIGTAAPPSGNNTLVFRPTGGGRSVSHSVTTITGSLKTIAAVRASNGSLASAALDDTGSVVPPGATKLRVLHLAPNAGELQVFRTQPDFQQPTRWQSPFTYQAEPTSATAPYFQSTVGSWEVRIWQSPADASGWANAPVKIVIPLGSGESKTVLMLDNPGGGVRAEVI